MTTAGKKNPTQSARAKNQRRDPSTGRFSKAPKAPKRVLLHQASASTAGPPRGKAAASVDDIVPYVPPGYKKVTPNRAAGSSSSSDGHKGCICCNNADIKLKKLKQEFMGKVETLEERNSKNSIKIYILEKNAEWADKAIARLSKAVKDVKKK